MATTQQKSLNSPLEQFKITKIFDSLSTDAQAIGAMHDPLRVAEPEFLHYGSAEFIVGTRDVHYVRPK